MPTFSYRCNHCHCLFDASLRVGENDKPTFERCPQCGIFAVQQIITSSPLFGDSYSLGHHPIPDDFKGLLRRIKEKNPNSNVNI
jgi:putative FmdB family regulatory protein